MNKPEMAKSLHFCIENPFDEEDGQDWYEIIINGVDYYGNFFCSFKDKEIAKMFRLALNEYLDRHYN